MSLRRAVLIGLIAINCLTLAAMAAYLAREDAVARRVIGEVRRHEQAVNQELKRLDLRPELRQLLNEVQAQVGSAIEAAETLYRLDRPERAELRLVLDIRRLPIFEDPRFAAMVDRAILVKTSDSRGTLSATSYNVGREFLFEPESVEGAEASEFVERAYRSQEFWVAGSRIGGAIAPGGKFWGGFYFHLKSKDRPREHTVFAASLQAFFLLFIPTLLLGPVLLWRFFSARVITPLEELQSVAHAVGTGDYSVRVRVPEEPHDEVQQTAWLLNRMLDLIASYRDELEARVEDKSRELESRNVELRLAQRLAATGTLAAGIAHEINNPLAGMLNIARRLGQEDLPVERRERYLAVLIEGIERIGAIVKKLLAVSPRKMVPTAIAMPAVVQHALDLVRHRAVERGVQLQFTEPSALPQVLGEANELGQVALNLLINAVDASAKGQTVVASLCHEGQDVVLRVTDRGDGMDAETAEQAFNLFFTTKGDDGGTGLGLAMVRGIVDGHGGSIHIDSTPGEGTTVIVRLPRTGTSHAS